MAKKLSLRNDFTSKLGELDWVNYSWLGLGDISKIERENPLLKKGQLDIATPGMLEARLMRDPNYLAYACRVILNLQILPIQSVILQSLWNSVFPMFIGSRGLGKTFLMAVYNTIKCITSPGTKIVIVGSGYRQAKLIFEYMEVIWKNAPILRDICTNDSGPKRDNDRCTMHLNVANMPESYACALPLGDGCLSRSTIVTTKYGFDYLGNLCDIQEENKVWGNSKFRQVSTYNNNGFKPTKIIRTKKGYEFEGTYKHRMKICRNGKIVWIKADEMLIGDRILIDRSERWHDGQFNCTEIQAHNLGVMIGDGCWTRKYLLRYATIDAQLAEYLQQEDPAWHLDGDNRHWIRLGIQNKHNWLNFWNLPNNCYTPNKFLPDTILSAPKDKMAACLRGLFDSDGTVQVSVAKGGTAIYVGFCNTSKKLVRQMQYILLHYGIISCVMSRQRTEKPNLLRIYELLITGQNAVKFGQRIGFGLDRKNKILQDGIKDKIRTTMVDDTIPDVRSEMLRVAKSNIVIGNTDDTVNFSKIQSRKEITFEYANRFLKKYGNIKDDFINQLRELVNPDVFYDEIISIKDGETDTYDIEIPDGNEYCANGFYSHNSKIRGIRANIIEADEFASIPVDIYETVVAGFAAVSSSPIDNVKEAARRKELAKLGIWTADAEQKYNQRQRNQAIISGTADYAFKSFAKYWRRYKSIIESKGDLHKLYDILGSNEIPNGFDWRDFSIIRIPYELIPEGFMDEKQVTRAKATISSGVYGCEYGSVFVSDSEGFFKRSLIEACVGTPNNPVILPSGNIWFDASLHGSKTREYVIGVDPASEDDNFSIIVLEICNDHCRIVYCWSTTREEFKKKLNAGLSKHQDFYGFCARKIRELMKAFPTTAIALDGQGGGVTVEEALHDPDKMEPGELPIWAVIDENKAKDSDNKPGLHILHVCQFANGTWTSQANHGLRKDMEDRVLIFPRFDPITLGMAAEEDGLRQQAFEKNHPNKKFNMYDTLEDCVMEIEELKTELSTIVMTQTSTGAGGRDRWDTPEVKLANGKKGRLRKDRYSALVMANMVARQMKRADVPPEYNMIGDFAGNFAPSKELKGNSYSGPEWFTQGMNDLLTLNY